MPIEPDSNIEFDVNLELDEPILLDDPIYDEPPPEDDFGTEPPPEDDFGTELPLEDDFGTELPLEDDFGTEPPPEDDFGTEPPLEDDFGTEQPPAPDDGRINALLYDDMELLPIDDGRPPVGFGESLEDIRDLTIEEMQAIGEDEFAELEHYEFGAIPPDAFTAFKPEQLSKMDKETTRGINNEQFKQMPLEALDGLHADNIGGLAADVIGEFTPEHLNALNYESLSQANTEDICNMLTHFDIDKIEPSDVEKLIPENWEIDLETGELTAEIGAKLMLQHILYQQDDNIQIPELANLNTGFGLGGNGTDVIEYTKHLLPPALLELENTQLFQSDEGILTLDLKDSSYNYMPDANNIYQADMKSTSAGINLGTGGFLDVTTETGLKYKLTAAPHNLTDFKDKLGSDKIVIGEAGDILTSSIDETRRSSRRVIIVDPCVGNNCTNGEEERIGTINSSHATEKIVYANNTSQKYRPTVLSPNIFTQIASKIKGVETIVFNADGSFYVVHDGNKYRIIPTWDVKIITVVPGSFSPGITINADGTLDYKISTNASNDEIMVFNVLIEPIINNSCVENSPGNIICSSLF